MLTLAPGQTAVGHASVILPSAVRLAPQLVVRWTDDPVTTETPIKAVHVNELRRAVDTLRLRADLPAFSWTDDPVMSGATVIRATHFLELRQATQDLWDAVRLGPLPHWAVGSPPASQRVILASDVNDLRQWTSICSRHVIQGHDSRRSRSILQGRSPWSTTRSTW